MTLGDWILALQIGMEDGGAVLEFIDELNTNPKCIRGIKAIEHAIGRFHSKSSKHSETPPYTPPSPATAVQVLDLTKQLQNHIESGSAANAAGNPDADSPGGSHGVSI